MNLYKLIFLITTTTFLSANSAETMYLHKCAGCHGHNGGNTVLGKSKMINQMKAEEIERALFHYAAGTCEVEATVCEPKNPMIQHGKRAIVKNFTKEQIRELSIYISQLK